MHYSVYAGLTFAALFGLVAPFIARRIAPAAATWLLSIGSLVSGACAACSLGLLGMTLIAQNPAIAAEGHWSITALRHADPVRFPVAVTALGLLALCLARFAIVLLRRGRALQQAYRLNRDVDDTGSDLVVLPDSGFDAYAVPGRPGRVFVTRGMLTLLSREECDVMLAHERAHLRHHHHWHRLAVTIGRSLNPLLSAVPRTQTWVTERWADEDAARGSERRVVAAALRRAAAADRVDGRPDVALAYAADTVESRVAALLRSPPRRRHWLLILVALAILTLSVCGTFDGIADEFALFHGAVVLHAHTAARQ
jgi:Zn-dependent protease with chaperone function